MSKYEVENWMGCLPDAITEQPLNTIAIPGSHDSFTFCFKSSLGCSPDADPGVKCLAAFCCGHIEKWMQTQKLNFTQQLTAGIRYLDLRTAKKPEDSQFYLVHGFYCCTVKEALNDVVSFLDDHPKEVVLLDFNHFYNMSDTDYTLLIAEITTSLGGKLCPCVGGQQTSLKTFWQKKQQAIVFFDAPTVVKEHKELWPGGLCFSLWPNTSDPQKMLEFLDKYYETEHCINEFRVFQGVLTPDAGYVCSHLMAGLADSLSRMARTYYLPWLRGKRRGLKGINICLMDFIEEDDYVNIVVGLNYDCN